MVCRLPLPYTSTVVDSTLFYARTKYDEFEKEKKVASVLLHAYNPSTLRAEAGGL